MGDPVADLRRDYTPRFHAYLARRDEAGLHSAYELGRRAMQAGVGLLELVRVHHEVYLAVMETARDLSQARDLSAAAAAYLSEALGPFEMTQRGFMAGDALEGRAPGTER